MHDLAQFASCHTHTLAIRQLFRCSFLVHQDQAHRKMARSPFVSKSLFACPCVLLLVRLFSFNHIPRYRVHVVLVRSNKRVNTIKPHHLLTDFVFPHASQCFSTPNSMREWIPIVDPQHQRNKTEHKRLISLLSIKYT